MKPGNTHKSKVSKARMCCLLDLLNIYREMIMKEFEVIQGFVITGRTLHVIRYVDNVVLIADTKIKLQESDRNEKIGLKIQVRRQNLWLSVNRNNNFF